MKFSDKKERRRTTRFTLIVSAEVAELPRGAKLSARCSDVSRTGCYFDTLNPIRLGKSVRVKLMHKNDNFETTGRVVFVSPSLGMGIEFDASTPADQYAILDRWFAEADQFD
ncbi:MAG: PilZ domain-containing protein [Acidobacteriia bacterium]|nr:PilZ domain-containing protein [Terriglobia bacterium]